VLVIDGRIGFTGGVGIAAEWTGNAEDTDHWRDDHFRVTGPAVSCLPGGFAENWLDATGEVVAAGHLFPALQPCGEARILPILASPRGDRSPIAFSYWIAFRTARRRIDITTPYFVADRSLLDEMKAAVTRGVEVRLLVPGDETDGTLVRLASLALYPELIAAGVRTFEYQTTLIHAKVMVIDDDWSMIGSANFDNRSFELNDEIVLYVEDREFAERLTQSLQHDLERSVLITLDRYRTIALWRRLLGRLALASREQL
jgi:cardiolipin synthase